MIDILECPAGRLLDCLIALSTQAYNFFADALTEADYVDQFITLAENDFTLMEQQKMAALNPTLISLALKLASSENDKGRKLARKIARFTHDTF